MVTSDDIERAYHHLNRARLVGDPLKIDLAQAALDDLLDRYLRRKSEQTPPSDTVLRFSEPSQCSIGGTGRGLRSSG